MQVNITALLDKNTIEQAHKVLTKCVHCGFCLATCPTYRILGEEANSPRGRIYTIKTALEGEVLDVESLDKCLICRSCETTCPSGVEYHKLLEVGKELARVRRPVWQKLLRKGLATFLTNKYFFNIGAKFIAQKATTSLQSICSEQKVILHNGCVQKPLLPNINNATTQVLNALGYEVIHTDQKECCGAIDMHLDNTSAGIKQIKQNIDHWWQLLQDGAECIISNASGCGLMIKDYAEVLQNDEKYQQKAHYIAANTRDISEFLADKDLSIFSKKDVIISYHEPCTLQHGQRLAGATHTLLQRLGYRVQVIPDNHLCCGSAGTYSIFQPKIAQTLRDDKLQNLGTPDVVVSSNIGCIMHLQKGTKIPVKHWIELLI